MFRKETILATIAAVAVASVEGSASYDTVNCPNFSQEDYLLISPMANCGAAGGNPMPCFHDAGLCVEGGAQEKFTKCDNSMREVFDVLSLNCDDLLNSESFDASFLCGTAFGLLLDGVCITPDNVINLMRDIPGYVDTGSSAEWGAYIAGVGGGPGNDGCPLLTSNLDKEDQNGHDESEFYFDNSCYYELDDIPGQICDSGYTEVAHCTQDNTIIDYEFCCRLNPPTPTPPPTDASPCDSEAAVNQALTSCNIFPNVNGGGGSNTPTPPSGGGGACPTIADLGVLTKVFPSCGPLANDAQIACMEAAGACPGQEGSGLDGEDILAYKSCADTLDDVMNNMNIGMVCTSLLGDQASMCGDQVGHLLYDMCGLSRPSRALKEQQAPVAKAPVRRSAAECIVSDSVADCTSKYSSSVCAATVDAACASAPAPSPGGSTGSTPRPTTILGGISGVEQIAVSAVATGVALAMAL